jgi:hypothetical protein
MYHCLLLYVFVPRLDTLLVDPVSINKHFVWSNILQPRLFVILFINY